jgi:ERF superfamily
MADSTRAAAKQPGTLAEALTQLQKDLPRIGKQADAQYGKYADLADITKKLMPKLAAVGLAFTARPTLHFGEPGDIKFVLAYELLHVSGESKQGFYPLGTGNPQQLGSAITYARRYALCAVTGVAPDEDDDDAAEASREPYEPEVREDGSATEAEQARMNRGPVPGTKRLKSTPPDDKFYDTPHTDRTPREEPPGTASRPQLNKIFGLFDKLGYDKDDRDGRLDLTRELVGRVEIQSSAQLSYVEADRLAKALEERVKGAAVT